MTNRRNYPRLRNGKLEGGEIPPHFLDKKKMEVVFHFNDGFSVTRGIPAIFS